MDISKFTEKITGKLVPITTLQNEKDHAFIPNPLPPQWTFDHTLWPLLVEARSSLSLLDGTAGTLAHPMLLLHPLRRLESLTSSRLEGTYATAQELMLFELDKKDSQGSHSNVDARKEVSNYNRALTAGFHMLKRTPFCLRLIRKLHNSLLRGVRGHSKNPGEFRIHQVHVGSNRRFVPPPAHEMLKCLNDLENYFNTSDNACDPLVHCFLIHYQFEAIHPFGDGNGRIGRVLLSLMIYHFCKLKMPWLYLSPYFERYKDEYIDNLFKISTEGTWSKWIEFCLRGVIYQAKDGIKKCEQLRELKKQMHEQATDANNSRIRTIIDDLFDSPYVRITELSEKHKVTYSTSKKDVSYLIGKGVLKELKDVKIKTFFAPQIFDISYGQSNE